jgi:hypothetical protein
LIDMADPLKPFQSPNNVRCKAISGSLLTEPTGAEVLLLP